VKRTILTLLICISFIGISYGQVKIYGKVYFDSILTKQISKVKITLKLGNKTEVYKTDKFGNFDISTKMEKFTLEIKKKGYISVNMTEILKDMHFDVLMRRAISIHDKDYKGLSKVILRN
jgi:hypothetical protein